MYNIEDKSKRELYTIKVLDSIIVRYEYIWAYSFEEACEIAESQGYEIVD